MTLTEFLLARIAEDEADPDCGGVGEYAGCDRWSERRLAECEAKRRIVEDYIDHCATYRAAPTPFGEGERFGLLLALARLVDAHTDHPDYLPEWKP